MQFIIGLVIFVVIILIIRLFGAWMLRIDEIIRNQKEMLNELKKANSKSNISSTTNQKDKTTKLKELKFLFDEGVITKEDYESKKTELYPIQKASEPIKKEKDIVVINPKHLPNNTKTVTFKSVNGNTVTVNYKKFLKVVENRDIDSYIILNYTTTEDN